MEKGTDNKDGRDGELELVSDDTAWKTLAGVQLLLLVVVSIWAMADRKPEIMLFSLIPLVFFFIYAARTRGGAKRLRFGPSSVRFEKLSGQRGEIQREMVEKVEVRRGAAETSVTVHYRRGGGGGRLRLSMSGDAGAGVAEGLREMGYGVSGD
jgi:hypothetical protein